MKDGEPTLETVHPHPRSTAAKEIPSIETPETSASLPTATNIHINTNTDTDTDTDTATISTVDTIHKKPLSEILPVFQLQRPLPEFRLPSNDRSIQVMTVQFQRQLRKQGKLMQKQINQLNRSHEVDLANVVLAYDTRMETLENRMDVRKSNNSKLNTMLEQAQQLLRDQKNQVKILQKKIKIQHDAMKASVHHHRHSGGSHHSPLIIGLSSPDALLTNSHEMWTSRDSPNGSGGRVSFDGDFHSTGAGGNRRDSNLSDWGNNNDRRSSGMVGIHNARDVDPTEMLRMREEIQQYQEALAEASKTIETMESRFVDQTNTQQEKQDDERVIDTMKHLQRRASNTEDALKTEQRIRIRMEAELERAKNGILELETTNEKLRKETVVMRTESARVRQEVAISEAKINAQLKGAAIQMKKTLKQCHMLEELIRPEITCNNCFEILTDAQVLYPCGHSFCDDCVDQMERPEDAMIVCQVCQALVPRADTCPNISLQAICPRVAWWSEPISQLKQIFHDFSGKDFVAQQTFAGNDFNPNAKTEFIADARTTTILIRIAGAVKETGKSVAVLFEEFDDDKGGTVDYEELEQGLHSINIWLSPDDFQRLLGYADPNGDGEIEYHEFAELLDHMLTMREGRDHSMQRGAAALDPMVNNARNKGY
jgi:hypothetical protein